MQPQVFFFSGLGADERVFRNLALEGMDVHFVKWIKPAPEETMEHYARRISNQVYGESPVLVGLSFGGIMAQEVAKIVAVKQVILLASVACRGEIPWYLRCLKWSMLHKLVPKFLFSVYITPLDWFFGLANEEERSLLTSIIQETDVDFAAWAVHQVVVWSQAQKMQNVVSIHGTQDRIFPIRYIHADYQVIGGGHFMTLNKSQEISSLLNKLIHHERDANSEY